ncbi:MAG TPA: hypothetical protein VFA86_11390 [Gammaproteobacteria bacterium]|nr:hypothetical protein [Gammaproteobacteria bacterium]
MAGQGTNTAVASGTQLPEFSCQQEAEAALFAWRDEALVALLADVGAVLKFDFSGKSLKRLEAWFLGNGRPEFAAAGCSVPHAIGFYLGQIFRRTGGFAWMVQESPSMPRRYEIGVKRPHLAIMLTRGERPSPHDSARKHALWRRWKRYVDR